MSDEKKNRELRNLQGSQKGTEDLGKTRSQANKAQGATVARQGSNTQNTTASPKITHQTPNNYQATGITAYIIPHLQTTNPIT